jgi:UDP-N-acetylglucosamine 2-epimerase
MLKVLSLVGARPQFIKEAVVNEAVRKAEAWEHVLVNSGQHYDFNMAGTFFDELNIPVPNYNMGVGSGTHAEQTADAMCKFEIILLDEKPDLVLLYGDTNTTLAGAIAASKLHIPIAHVEAGPRSYNKLFPEEVNRVLTDHISDLLFACTSLNVENLAKEGIVQGVHNAGDVMYDLYAKMRAKLSPEAEMEKYSLDSGKFIIATIHRDFNTDNRDTLQSILTGLNIVMRDFGLKVILPLHPRTRNKISLFGLGKMLDKITVTEPLGYLEFMSLTQNAAFVITDSGGFQKESYWAGKRGILTMPQGWQEITDTGWHKLIDDPIQADWKSLISDILQPFEYPANIFGDGHAAEKIVKVISETLSGR